MTKHEVQNERPDGGDIFRAIMNNVHGHVSLKYVVPIAVPKSYRSVTSAPEHAALSGFLLARIIDLESGIDRHVASPVSRRLAISGLFRPGGAL